MNIYSQKLRSSDFIVGKYVVFVNGTRVIAATTQVCVITLMIDFLFDLVTLCVTYTDIAKRCRNGCYNL